MFDVHAPLQIAGDIMTVDSYPFPFVDRGVWDTSAFVKDYHIVVWFAQPVAAAARETIATGRPEPFEGGVRWGGGRVMTVIGGSAFEENVSRRYNEVALSDDDDEEEYELSDEDVEALYRDIDAWLTSVHADHPIVLAAAGRRGEDDAWQDWSMDQLPQRAHAPLLRYFQQTARPPSDAAAQQANSEERMLVSLVLQVGETNKEELGLADPDNARLAELLRAAKGYNGFCDGTLDHYLRALQRA